MRKITDEGFLFLYGAGLLVTAETGIPAVITILFACIYTCVNLVGEEKYLHYIMTIAFVAAGIVFKEMWMFLPVVLYNMLCFYSPVYIGVGGIIVACEAPAFREYYGLEKEMLIVAGLAAAVLLYGRTRRLNELEQEYKRARDDSRELTLMLEKKNQDLLEKQDTEVYLATLKERNRIAREIHDNVGHMLSRSILMVGALKTVNQAENLKVPMEQLNQTLNEAMTNAVKAAAAKGGFDIEGMEIIDPATYPEMDAMVAKMVELRKGKMSEEDCRAALSKGNYFGTMLVKMGKADALLGGATYSTADTVRPALQLIKTKPGAHLVSSCFILVREKDGVEEKLAMGDCAINIDYPDSVDKEGNVTLKGSQKLAEVAIETANTAKAFGIDPKVAVLSFSTKGSGKGGTVALSREATEYAKEMNPELAIDGELQFDAAVSPVVAATKCKGSPVAGQANTFIFPSIEAGNIGYKIAQRLGGFAAYGPILQGLNAPINDLSRGCNADEVYQMAIITAGLK